MASLPRPSRPSLPVSPQPSGPLPSIPIPKSRQTSIPSSGATTPGSQLPQPSSARTASSSSIPNSASTHTSNTSIASVTSQTPGEPKTALRKTISYNSFPRPPTGLRTPSGTSPTSSTSTTPRASRQGSTLPNGVSRSVSVHSAGTRTSNASVLGTEQTAVIEDATTDDSPRGRHRPSSSHGKDKGNVVISVRVRPEKDANGGVAAAGEWMVEGKKSAISYKGKEGGEYIYDNVFTAHDKNEKVYLSAAKRLVRRVMEGYNGTVFAYGMTGTGKTYSMQGTHQHPGVTPSAITDIFSYIRETPQREFLLRVSYLEIYNEKIHDLLADDAGLPTQIGEEIKLREDQKGNVYATPLKEEVVQSPTQLLRVIARGDLARKTSSTQFNARSSRSHAVVSVVVESRERKTGTAAAMDAKRGLPVGTRISTLSLIDLAGSERAAETKERREEGSHINRSLLTLGTVISKLSGNKDKNGQPTDKQGKHLPYRDSKLTRLLQPALAGNSLISILCTIQLGSAGSSAMAGNHIVETLNTLKFAARARNNIVSHAKRSEEHANINDAGSRALLDRYAGEIRELKKQLENKTSESAKIQPDEEEENQRKEEEKTRDEERVTELHLAQLALADRIRHLNALILSSKSNGVNQMRSYSSLSLLHQRMSTMSNATDTRSIRSSASNHTLDAKPKSRHSNETATGPDAISPSMDDEEGDVNGYGDASKDAQIKSLQADLSDKNRYIESLENRLRQARRSSKSRVSMLFQGRPLPITEQGGVEVLLRDKDAEISELREQLDDKERSLNALRSAARQRDTFGDMTPTATATPPQRSSSSMSLNRPSSQTAGGAELNDKSPAQDPRLSRRTSANSTTADGSTLYRSSLLASRRSSSGPGPLKILKPTSSPTLGGPSVAPLNNSSSASTPATKTVPDPISTSGPRSLPLRSPRKRNHGVDDMTRLLDDMIRQKVEEQDAAREINGGATSPSADGRSNSLNLLAMRDSPIAFSKGKRNARQSNASEGLGIGSRLNGVSRDVNGVANGVLGASSSEKRRTSLLSQSQIQGHRRTRSSKEKNITESTETTAEAPNQSQSPASPTQNGISAIQISPTSPRKLHMTSTSATQPSVSRPTSSKSAKSIGSTRFPVTPSSSSTSMPKYNSSTNTAQQATEALRHFIPDHNTGADGTTDDDTEAGNETDKDGADTVASSTIGVPTVIDGDTVYTRDIESLPLAPVILGSSPMPLAVNGGVDVDAGAGGSMGRVAEIMSESSA